ncbi:MAG: carboxypeptidase-like regulatory domain-containing protein [Desulfobaccales bacterium]
MPGTFAYDAGTNTVTVIGGTSGSPADFASMYAADVANGWGKVTNPGASTYMLICNLMIGDGSTSTYFKSLSEFIIFNGDYNCFTLANATLQSGNLVNSYGKKGSCWLLRSNCTYMTFAGGGTVLLYGTYIYFNFGPGVLQFNGSLTCVNTMMYINAAWITFGDLQYLSITETYIAMELKQIYFWVSPNLFILNHFHDCYPRFTTPTGITLSELNSTGTSPYQISSVANTIDVINPLFIPILSKIQHSDGSCITNIQYTLSCKVNDISGIGVANALVEIKDNTNTVIFSVYTDADGEIAQQIVTAIKFAGSPAAETDYSPFILTITADGYQDYQDVIVIDRKMDLEVAMLGEAAGGGVSPTSLGLVPLGIKQVAV